MRQKFQKLGISLSLLVLLSCANTSGDGNSQDSGTSQATGASTNSSLPGETASSSWKCVMRRINPAQSFVSPLMLFNMSASTQAATFRKLEELVLNKQLQVADTELVKQTFAGFSSYRGLGFAAFTNLKFISFTSSPTVDQLCATGTGIAIYKNLVGVAPSHSIDLLGSATIPFFINPFPELERNLLKEAYEAKALTQAEYELYIKALEE